MLLHPIPSPAVLEPGKDQVQSYIAEMNPKILPPPARKATNPLELLHRAARLSAAARCALDANLGVKPPQRDTVFLLHFDPHDENIRWAQAKHILQLPGDPVILTHSCMTCTFQGVNTAHLYLMDQLSALISYSPTPTPLPMNRNRRADDLRALMLPSGSTGFSKALDCAEPRRFLDLVDRHRIFLGFAPNFFLALLYDRICRSTPKQEAQPAPTWGLSGLRCVFSGGEPTVRQLLLRLVHHVRQRLPRCPRQLYITGRFNNTLLLNGETIFPVEVECSLEQVRIPDLTSSFTLVFAHLAPDAHLRPTAQLRSGPCSSHAVISKEPRSVCPPDPTSGALDPEREAHEPLQPGLSSLDFYTVTQDLHQTFGAVLPLPTFSGNRLLPILPTASISQ
ncbi:hypothetical protein CBS147321_1738 [Aspergillus niger]|nr:hypothetical protein CBS11350_2473 [Aspergillus niger]KAI2852645.1 hypothetical protein CBS12448_8175 [Aspergillus niger]KAI2905002.1 hypothetical protein CBS11852_1237 [Aspergillus niger]KAI2943862.1 hypothetical protein CBS147322_8238 [Aspergillus niger]KAI2950096.1 hypothetical protein CBS147321_1738 [Aspergillus niger]